MASVNQGSSLGPASFIVTAADLHPLQPGNVIIKFADDTYLVIPASNTNSCLNVLKHIQRWALTNDLKLNRSKSQEIIFKARTARDESIQLPAILPDIKRVNSLAALGVVLQDNLKVTDHVNAVIASCSSLLYVLQVLRQHGMPNTSLQDVFRATVMSKMLYCCQAWSGFCSTADRQRLDSFIRRCIKLGYCAPDTPPIETLLIEADENLLRKVLGNYHHILYPLLPPPVDRAYNLCQRKHNRSLITKKNSPFNENNFIIRLLHREIFTDGHAVLIFALFCLNVFRLLALTFVAVTIFRSVYNCDVVCRCTMSHSI